MNLHASPGAPAALRIAADAILVLHITGGLTGIASGFVAMVAPKGGRLHQVAGTTFFVAMLTMTVIAATVSPLLDKEQWTNTTAGVFTLYLTATGWVAIKRRPGEVGRFEALAALIPSGIAAMGLVLAVLYAATPRAAGFASVYVFAGLSALAAACDFRMVLQGGLRGAERIARHLWRMGAALFVATGSLFLGQPTFLPEPIRGTLIPMLPVFAVLGLLVFWLIRVRFRLRLPSRPITA